MQQLIFLNPACVFLGDAQQIVPEVLALFQTVTEVADAVIVATPGAVLPPGHENDWADIARALQLPVVGQTDGDGPLGEQIARWLAALPEEAPYVVLHHACEWLPEQRARWVLVDPEERGVGSLIQLCELLGVEVEAVPLVSEDTPEWARALLAMPAVGGMQ